tara:strand:+ start:853 stop:996 length:144 start_codon:yes stop_codon:yes gene_type:complete
MTNTDIIHNTAIIYAQKKGMEMQITEELLQKMVQDLKLLGPEYGIEL